jgi:transcriptional regulator with XRE-family HTH domain
VPERAHGSTPRQHDELSSLLRRLRSDAGLSGPAAAALAADISQSSISRYERGLFVPGVEQATELARVYGASQEDRRRLLQMVRDLRENTTQSARVVMKRGGLQERIERIEESSIHLRTFQPLIVPGLFQTESYHRMVFAAGDDMAADVQASESATRTKRQKALSDGRHEVTVVIPEGALRWSLGGADVMVEQLERIVDRSRLAGVRVGVIPWSRAVDLAPTHGFDLFDERAALVGIETAATFLTNPADVAAYVKLFGELEALAVFGDEARSVVADVIDDLR